MVPWSRRLNRQIITWSRLSNQLWSASHWLPSSSSFPRTAHALTHKQTRACGRSANIHQNNRALYLINSAQIGKSHVDGALALAAIAAWHGLWNDVHLLWSCCPNLGILRMHPIGEAAPGPYGEHTWRMTRTKFADSQCDLQPASELSPSDPRRAVVWHLAKTAQALLFHPSTDALRTLQTKQGVNKARFLFGLLTNSLFVDRVEHRYFYFFVCISYSLMFDQIWKLVIVFVEKNNDNKSKQWCSIGLHNENYH